MNLILGGGGDAADSKIVHQLFVNRVGNGKKLLYIPVAWKDGDFDSCRSWFEATFANFHVSNFEMWTNLKDRIMEELDEFGGIYIGGGNTFTLLNILRTTKFDNLLTLFVKSGKPVFGGSAGAIIFGKTINTAAFCNDPDINDVGLTDFSGLNFVKNHDIQCHYVYSQDEEILSSVSNSKIPIIAISERSGIFISNKGMEIIGEESGYLFTEQGKVEYAVGDKLL